MRTLSQIIHDQMILARPPVECLDDEFDDCLATPIPVQCSLCAKIMSDEDAYCDDCGGRIV